MFKFLELVITRKMRPSVTDSVQHQPVGGDSVGLPGVFVVVVVF